MTKLEARCKAVNACHEAAHEWYEKLMAAFAPFVGQPVETVAGPLRANVKKVVDALDLPNTAKLQVFRSPDVYSLRYTVKTCVSDSNGHAYYHSVSLYLYNLSGTMLGEPYPSKFVGRFDYTPESVTIRRETYRKLKEAADVAKNDLGPFGEYDL